MQRPSANARSSRAAALPTTLSAALAALLLTTAPARAQQREPARGVVTHAETAAAPMAEERGTPYGALRLAAPTAHHACNTLCTTGVGALLGAGVGALARTIYLHNAPPEKHSIADVPTITLAGILGAVAGGTAGLTFGLVRH